MVGKLLAGEGVVVQPPLEQAGSDDWLVFSMPALGVTSATPPDPRPTAAWFSDKAGLRLGSEREVEMHFVSPLFEQLGYQVEQEAAGFGFMMWEGVRQHHAEADLLYFASDVHDVASGDPLVLVECKAVGKGPEAGPGQARSYAYWLKPAYYLVTDGDYLTVWNYQGALFRTCGCATPDVPRSVRSSTNCMPCSTRRRHWQHGSRRSSCSQAPSHLADATITRLPEQPKCRYPTARQQKEEAVSLFGRDDIAWDEMATAGEAFLIERARLARLTTYTELNATLARRTSLPGFDFDRQDERAAMAHLLGLIVERNRPATGLMISALVTYLDANDAGPGFCWP
jgi:hypothetical protein